MAPVLAGKADSGALWIVQRLKIEALANRAEGYWLLRRVEMRLRGHTPLAEKPVWWDALESRREQKTPPVSGRRGRDPRGL